MDFAQLSSLISAHADARIVHAAVELGIFDCLAGSPLTANQVRSALGTELAATELLLNSLVALRLLAKHEERFALTATSREFLLSASPRSLCGMVRFEAMSWSAWGKLADSVRSGGPARAPNMYQDAVGETETFIQAMDSLVKARGDAEILSQAIDWRNIRALLDIGSGPATYPIHLCRIFPELQATIFDLPATLKITERFVRAGGMLDRIELIAGDYRSESIPGQYDAIFLSNIVHGENDARNAALMQKLAGSLKSGGRVIVKDHILDESRANPPVGAIFSMLMLLTTDGGRCYSFGEIRNWMQQAGLQQIAQIDLPPPMTSSLVVGYLP